MRTVSKLALLICISFLSFAATAEIGDFIRDEDGSVKSMIAGSAITSCERQGLKLATVRDMANYAAEHEAMVLSVDEYQRGDFPPGYARIDFSLIRSVGTDGVEDNFYYSKGNYIRPPGEEGKYDVWTSSIQPGYDYYPYMFRAYDGALKTTLFYLSFGSTSGRCVPRN